MGALAFANWFVAPAVPDAGGSARPVIAVIDDDGAARDSLAFFLQSEGYRTLGFAGGEAFLEARLPELVGCVLLDMRMPGLSGLDVLHALAGRDDGPAVLVLTGHGDVAMAVQAMKLGALDFIEKPYRPAGLVRAIERAAALQARRMARRAAAARVEGLSRRQREVLAGIAAGRPNKIIAFELGLSVRTVEAYRAQLFERLGVRNTAEAVRLALAAERAAA